MTLTQAEADLLIAMTKIPEDPNAAFSFPSDGQKTTFPLISEDHREFFKLDVNRAGRLHTTLKITHQLRGRDVQLVRLDIGGGDHMNPDGVLIPCPHLHLYREGFGARWAVAVPPESFRDLSKVSIIFTDFLAYCRVTRFPSVNFTLS